MFSLLTCKQAVKQAKWSLNQQAGMHLQASLLVVKSFETRSLRMTPHLVVAAHHVQDGGSSVVIGARVRTSDAGVRDNSALERRG